MAGILVGSGYGEFGLSLGPLRQSAAEARTILKELDRDASALTRTRPVRLVDGDAAASSAKSVRELAREADLALKEFEAIERQVRRTTDAEIAAARASGDYDRALSLLGRELGAATENSERYYQIQQRITQTQAQRARAAEQAAATEVRAAQQATAAIERQARAEADATERRRSARADRNREIAGAVGGFLGGPVGALAGAASPIAAAGIVAGAAKDAVGEASRQAAAYRQQSQDLTILAGTTERYNELLRAARQNQVLFGGSITDNLDPLQQLIFISNRAKVGLTQLNETTKLLGATNSREGVGGAGFAIGEFLSGDTTSIVERFNLPRQAINDLKNEEISAAEKLEKLNELILQQGNVSAVLEQRLHGPQAEANRAGQAFERMGLAAGNAFNNLTGQLAGAANSSGVLDRIATAAERVAEAGKNGTPAIVAYWQAFQQAPTTAQIVGESVRTIAAAYEQLRLSGSESAAALAPLVPQLQAIAASSTENAVTIQNLVIGYRNGVISIEELRAALIRLQAQQDAAKIAAQQDAAENIRLARSGAEVVDASKATGDALAEEAKQKLESARRARELAEFQDTLARLGGQVRSGFTTAGNAATLMATKYGIAWKAAYDLVQLQAQLGQASTAPVKLTYAQQRDIREQRNSQVGGGGQGEVSGATAEYVRRQQEAARAAQAARAAEQRQIEATETAAQRVARLRKEEEAYLKGYGAKSAEYIDAKTDRIVAEQQLAAEQQRLGKASATAADKQAKAEGAALDQIEDKTEDHYQRLLQMQQDYQLQASRAQEDYDVRRSRAQEDFQRQYRRLLAEGKRFEAQQLKEQFDRQQQREREDFEREQRRRAQDEQTREVRETGKAQTSIDRIADRKGVAATQVSGAAAGQQQVRETAAGQAMIGARAPAGAPTRSAADVVPTGPITIGIQITPTPVLLDGQKIGEVVYDYVEVRLADDLSLTATASPPKTGAVIAVGGLRP